MKLIDLECRLAQIEAASRDGIPTMILSDHPKGEGPEFHLSDWQT